MLGFLFTGGQIMKRLAFLLISFLMILLFSGIIMAEEMTFRKTYWGMSLEQVKASETVKLFKQKGEIFACKTTVIGKEVGLGYFFINNQLVRAEYVLMETYTNKNNYIDDYIEFKKIITKKHGYPKTDETFWRNELFKDDRSNWGRAVSVGHLVYASTWETPSTKIILMLDGNDFEIACRIQYTGKNFAKLIEKVIDQKKLDSF